MRANLNPEYELIGVSPAIKQLERDIKIAAGHDENVLITGETGTGKEIVARQIHDKSQRSQERFVAVHCGALPQDLIESELFGHEAGSFTGAIGKKLGKLETADRGTALLDEVDTLAIDLQPKLLRWLEGGTFYRVGGIVELQPDVRVLSAMNGAPTPNRFRQDLLYRLNVDSIYVPALRERVEDITPIAQFYLDQLNRVNNTAIKFDDGARNALMSHTYQGNVRELENIVRYAFLRRSEEKITGDIIMRRLKQS